MDEEAHISMIKRQGEHMVLSNGTVVLRDFCHLQSPGVSLDSFLKSEGFSDAGGKFAFPFGWLTSLNQVCVIFGILCVYGMLVTARYICRFHSQAFYKSDRSVLVLILSLLYFRFLPWD